MSEIRPSIDNSLDISMGQELFPVQEEYQDQPPIDFDGGFDTMPSQYDEILFPGPPQEEEVSKK